MSPQPANEPDKQPQGKSIVAFRKPMAVVACGLSAQLAVASSVELDSQSFYSIIKGLEVMK